MSTPTPTPPPLLAGVQDLIDRGVSIPDDTARIRAESNLRDASALVRRVAQRAYTDPETGALADVPGDIVAVVCSAARRAYENPKGLSSENLGNYAYQRDKNTASGGVWLTDAERETVLLAVSTTRRTGGLGSLEMTRGTRDCYDRAVYDSSGHLTGYLSDDQVVNASLCWD